MSCEEWARPIKCVEQFDANGIPARELSVADFVQRRTELVVDIGFEPADAECLARLLTNMAGGCERILLALYPSSEEVWEPIAASDWVEWHRRYFRRRGFFPSGRTPWVVGSAMTPAKLTEIVHWAWTLPGRDTFLAVIAPDRDWRPLAALFEDDREDDGVNERRLVAPYPTVVSRGYRAESVRIVTRAYDIETLPL
ncbi:MAG TPA: hypothetical protein VJ276_10855 [Thermoanaerobaculia bacterium]|nr:hypothetical protein [Thermoanaerobaculia bacterium]